MFGLKNISYKYIAEMSYLNKQNVFAVASDIYKLVKERYGLDVEGQYLDDIQLIMSKLWDKNKDKQLKSTQSQRQFFGALNKKTVELVAPGVFRNIEAGYLNKTQNNIYVGEPQRDPQNQNPVDLFEKLKKKAGPLGQYADDAYGYYMFPKLDPKMYPIENDQDFIHELLQETKVLLVQGSGFNWPHTDHFRIVFLPHEDDLRIAINRIAKFLELYRQKKSK